MEANVTVMTPNLPESIARMEFSPGGGRLALANDDGPGEVLVIEVPGGAEVARYPKLADRPKVDFRSESELLIANGSACWLCDLTAASHRPLPLPPGSGWLDSLRVSPGGASAVLGAVKAQESGGLLILDLAGGGAPERVRVPCAAFTEAVTFSPDGGFVSVVHGPELDHRTERLISIFDVRGWKLVRQFKLPWEDYYVYPTAIEPQRRLIAVGWRSKVLLFDLDPSSDPLDADHLFGSDYRGVPMGWGQPIACHQVAGDREQTWRAEVREVWFSADGSRLKLLSDDGEAVLVSANDGEVLRRTPPPAGQRSLSSAQISRAGRVAVRGDEKRVLTWEVPWWGEA